MELNALIENIISHSVQEGTGERRGRWHLWELCKAALGSGAGEIC